jgi:hypothetical protein
MSYEKVKIVGVREITSKDTGEIHRFVEVEVMSSQSLYVNQQAAPMLELYKKLAGKEVLLPCAWGQYNGRPSLNFTDDAKPLPIPAAG